MADAVPPRFYDYEPELLEVAEWIVRDRRARYPELVQRHKLSGAEARDGLRAAEALAADWRRIVGCAPDEGGYQEVTIATKRQVLEQTRARQLKLLGNAHNRPEQGDLIACLDALLWHLNHDRFQRLRCVDLMLSMRAARADNERKAA